MGGLSARAQDENTLLQQADQAFQQQNFAQAADLAGQFVQQFPKSGKINDVKAILGLSQLALGKAAEALPYLAEYDKMDARRKGTVQYYYAVALAGAGQADKALPVLQKLLDPVLTNKKIEDTDPLQAQGLYPEILLMLARTAMEEGSKAKNPDAGSQNFKLASSALAALQTKYADSGYKTDADLAKATLAIYQKQYEQAEADLQALRGGELGALMAQDLDYLLGFVYSQRAQVLLGDFKKDEAAPYIAKARQIYQGLAQSNNLTVVSDAAFQLANLAMAEENYRDAIEAYRSLPTKSEVIQSQKLKIDNLKSEAAKAGITTPRGKQLDSLRKREEQKLKSVEGGPDLTIDALARIADCYLRLNAGDEARVVLRHLMEFDGSADRKKQYQVQLIISYATQGLAEKAEAGFADFKKGYPNDPMAQTIDFLIANALFQQKRYDEALQKLEKNLKEFPNSPVAAQIPALIAEIYRAKGEPDKAIQTFRQFIQDGRSNKIKVDPEAIDQAQYSLGLTLLAEAQKKDPPKDDAAVAKLLEESAALMKQLAGSAATPAMKEEASLQYASILSAANKGEEAIAAYRDFVAKFPNSARRMNARASIASALERSNKFDEALAAYREIVAESADAELSVFAYERIWKILQSQNKADESLKAQEEMLQKFPAHPRSLSALVERAKGYQKAREYDKAFAAYQSVYDYCKKLDASARAAVASYASFALMSAAEVRTAQAKGLGNYSALDAEKKKQWSGWMDEAEGLLKQMLVEFTDSSSYGFALNRLVDVFLAKMQAGTLKYDDALNYLSRLAGELNDPAASAQVLIARAGLVYESGNKSQAKTLYADALKKMDDPKKLAWNHYARYGDILLESGDFDEALKIGKLLQEHFPDKFPQSNALYILGVASASLGKNADAEAYLKELKEKYPWSPKIQEAELSRGEALAKGGKPEEALKVLKDVLQARKPTDVTPGINSRAMMGIAHTLFVMGEGGKPVPADMQEKDKPLGAYDLSANYYLKVEAFYGQTLPAVGAEALFHVVEVRLKQGKKEEALKFYQEMSQKFPTSPWTPKAKDLLGP
jgi:tetratricopeptide (TPR) repeat protein